LQNGGELLQTFEGHAEPVRCVAFCPDGKTLASGSDDKTIKLWDIATGEPKSTLKGHKYRVWSLGFTPHGQHLMSASLSIRVWHAPHMTDLSNTPQPQVTWQIVRPFLTIHSFGGV